MSEAFDRGRSFENKVRKIMSSKLQLNIKRDKQSGAGIHKQDIRDQYGQLPLFIECKDHKTTKLKEWWREADGKSNFGQAPVVVFPDNEEVLCVMRFEDLLNIVRESMDWKDTAEDLRVDTPAIVDKKSGVTITGSKSVREIVEDKIARGANECRNGHIADQYGYCMQLDCKYSRGYRAPKVKKK
ncbi:hypothetical protein HZA56_14075 [Candidatus Poribacteria bacterium]|nr:hypothetical protein [Candidatus Poribacteria bacterium]